mmetsp:Transcript_103333/g.230813  ORF Transcript_103333/g.230813 Transcript_103333/m.230813 type:complete len:212 (+) Transcript_103333:82-717(+)
MNVYIGLCQEDVIELVLSPLSWLGLCGVCCAIVQARDEPESLGRQLRRPDAKLVLQFSDGCPFHARHIARLHLLRAVDLTQLLAAERVGTTSIGPDEREGDLRVGTLLQQQATLPIEEEDGEGAVQAKVFTDASIYAGGAQAPVRGRLASATDDAVLGVHEDALVCSHELFLRASSIPEARTFAAGIIKTALCHAESAASMRRHTPTASHL